MEVFEIVISDSLVLADPRQQVWRYLSIGPGSYRVSRRTNPTGLGVDWLYLEHQPYGTSEPVWRMAAGRIIDRSP